MRNFYCKTPLFLFLISLLVFNLALTESTHAAKSKKKKKEVSQVVIHISPDVIDALKLNDIDGAIRSIRMEATSPRSKYLLREMQRIAKFNKTGKKQRSKDRRLLFNVGVAYHNLYLFLKSEGIQNTAFFKNAERFYLKALKTKSPARKNQISLTLAALYASGKNTKKATKYFDKTNPALISDNFRRSEAMALYYASLGNAQKALTFLESAYSINPAYTRFWLGISDDFYLISGNPRFKELCKEWEVKTLNMGPAPLSSKDKEVVN